MADTVTGFTATRMQAIEDQAVVGATVVGDDLIMTRYNTTTFNAGNVRGAVGPQNPDGNPAGTIIMGGWGTAPTGYLFFGQTVVGGASTYSALATIYPDWVVGADLVIPNADGAVPMQGATTGVVSGSMTHTLSVPQLPGHTHSGPSHTHSGPSHTHSGPSHTHSGPAHSHTLPNHSHSSVAVGNHGHQYPLVGSAATASYLLRASQYIDGANYFRTTDSSGVQSQMLWSTAGGSREVWPDGAHSHTINGSGDLGTWASGTADTGSAGTGATGPAGNGATGASGTANTGSTGTNSPIDHTPKNLTIRYAVKT